MYYKITNNIRTNHPICCGGDVKTLEKCIEFFFFMKKKKDLFLKHL